MQTLADLAKYSGVTFGTSGARGLVEALTDEVCQAYVMAFLHAVAGAAPAVLLGCDLRPSSPQLVRACAGALQAAGKQVIFCGSLPTPALACHAQAQALPAIMVTGSHIPFDRNGLKFYRADGEISKADEAAMLAAPVAPPVPALTALPPVSPQPLELYRQRYLQFFPAGLLAGWRIGVYQHSGVARDFLGELLSALGAEVIALGRTDTFVPVDTEAVSEADQAQARRWVAQHGLQAIVSTDGDADRPLLADETGHWLRGDLVGLLCARYLGVAALAVPVSCNTAIEQCGSFGRVLRSKIGSPYVIAAMQQLQADGNGPVAGFEANGGFLLGDSLQRNGCNLHALPTRDAVLPLLALLAAAAEQGVTLSALQAGLPQRHTASDRLPRVPQEASRAVLAQLAGGLQQAADWLGDNFAAPVAMDHTDGLRLTLANAEVVHLRPSGNAPELRCYAEADSQQRAQALVAKLLAQIAANL